MKTYTLADVAVLIDKVNNDANQRRNRDFKNAWLGALS